MHNTDLLTEDTIAFARQLQDKLENARENHVCTPAELTAFTKAVQASLSYIIQERYCDEALENTGNIVALFRKLGVLPTVSGMLAQLNAKCVAMVSSEYGGEAAEPLLVIQRELTNESPLSETVAALGYALRMVALNTQDTAAFDELYERYSTRLLHYFYRMLGKETEKAQDFLQDLLLKIVEKPHLFDTRQRFSTWVYTIASNMCKNEYRRLQVRQQPALSRF